MMAIYPVMRIQLSFIQFSLLCCEFCILSKTESKSIYYHFRRDHESNPEMNGFVKKLMTFFVINLLISRPQIFGVSKFHTGNQYLQFVVNFFFSSGECIIVA